ncbi:HNH endonuclease [Priestia megaterium]
MTKKIELSNGGFALVDDEDYEFLNQWKWRDEAGYAVRTTTTNNNRKRKIRMSRLLMGYPKGKVVDHKNRNRLDNRKSNLRICFHYENSMNIVKNPNLNTTSQYKGVIYREGTDCWRVRINAATETIDGGNFTNEVAAANCYNYYCKNLHGEFANLNDCPYMEKEEWESYKTNRKKAKITSKYVGVGWNKRKSKWRAYVGYKGKQYHIGYFEDQELAALKRDEYIIENKFDLPLNFELHKEIDNMELIKFYKDGCNPCTMVDNFLKDAGVEYKSIHVFENPEIAGEYDLASVPVTILLDDQGNEVKRSYGFNPPELEEMAAQL